MIFSYFESDIRKCKPLGVCSIADMIRVIKSPNTEILNKIERIREASANGNETEKQRLKTQLFFFTPAVIMHDWRSYDNIDSFTGLMPFDFDKLDPDYAVEFKHYIFNNYPFVVASWLSVSGRGVRFLVKIPEVRTIEQYKGIFNALRYYEKFGEYTGFDPILCNPIQPLFISYDPDLLYRDDYKGYYRMYVEPLEKKDNHSSFKEDAYKPFDSENKIKFIISKKIAEISGNGHHPLRAVAFLAGGYVAGGAITENDAINYLHEKISQHPYLSKKAETYKKTATYMVKHGQSKPLKF